MHRKKNIGNKYVRARLTLGADQKTQKKNVITSYLQRRRLDFIQNSEHKFHRVSSKDTDFQFFPKNIVEKFRQKPEYVKIGVSLPFLSTIVIFRFIC